MSPSKAPGKRLRLDAAAARQRILDVAEKRLIEGGPETVRVQAIAHSLGITDAAVHHHFGSRQGLLEALLRRAGRSMAEEMERILSSWDGDPASLGRVAELIADTYAQRGFARLALWLSFQGWSSPGSGMFASLVDALHTTRLRISRERGAARPRRQDAQHAVALLNLALVAEPLVGEAFLRSVDIEPEPHAQLRFHRWLVRTIVAILLSDAG